MGTREHRDAEESGGSFGDRVRRRREELGLSLRDIALQGGPSPRTQLSIERDDERRPRSETLRKLDAVLQWKEGTSIAALFGTGEPDEDRQPPPGVMLSLAEVVDLVRWTSTLVEARQRLGQSTLRPEESEALDQLGAMVSDLFREALEGVVPEGPGATDPVTALYQAARSIHLLDNDDRVRSARLQQRPRAD